MRDVIMAPSTPETVEQFLDWPGDDRAKHYELVDGVVRAMSPASTTLATIQGNLAVLIGSHLRASGSPCRLLVTPGVIPRMNAARNFRIPDLGVTCAPDAERQIDMPDPILLVEILSPSNEADIWSNIWTYGTLPSLLDVLIVHSTKVTVQLLSRGPDGTWPDNAVKFNRADSVRLPSIDLACPVDAFYAGTRFADP